MESFGGMMGEAKKVEHEPSQGFVNFNQEVADAEIKRINERIELVLAGKAKTIKGEDISGNDATREKNRLLELINDFTQTVEKGEINQEYFSNIRHTY